MDTKILLENGTNELEILEFTLAGNSYGINVAKIKEIITYQPVTPVPNSHPSIEGIFMPRDTMITAIDLKNCLGRGESEKKGLFIVTNFNKLDIAFHVETVLGIHRVSWRDIIKPDITISAADESVATGIIKKNDKLIIILDFEKIVSDINPETGLKMSELSELGERTRSSVPILIAEDSPLLNKLIVDSLKSAGYVNLIHTENGQQAYDVITQCKEDGTLDQHVRCIITDIEMPEMDGHRLTKLVKTDDATKDIPVIIFSSLVNDDMKRKGEALGADAQLSKPEIGNLVKIVDELVAADESVATGIIKKNDKLIIILDFEKIVSDINPETGLKMSELSELGERTRSSVPILIAEDSPLLNKLIVDSLKSAGYVNLIHTENGQQAYDVITQCKEDGTLDQHVRCIITDIEMPEMDGHRLTKLVKTDDATKDIPVIIFSSLVNDDMKRKGEALGADAQLSKPEIGNLVKIVDELVAEKHLDR